VRWVGRDFLDIDVSDMAGERLSNISYAIIYIVGRSLGEHLDGAVREIADVAGQLMPAGHSVSRESKAHALNTTLEDYMPCNHARLTIYYLLLTVGLHAKTAIC